MRQAVEAHPFDDVIVSTLPRRTSEWLRLDLPRRVKRLGLPVTVITPERDSRVDVLQDPIFQSRGARGGAGPLGGSGGFADGGFSGGGDGG